MPRSLYEVIGVSPNASQPAIEARCLDLGKRYRPSGSMADDADRVRFAEVNRAYEILVDPVKRQAYDAKLLKSKLKYQRIYRSIGWAIPAVILFVGIAANLIQSKDPEVFDDRRWEDAQKKHTAEKQKAAEEQVERQMLEDRLREMRERSNSETSRTQRELGVIFKREQANQEVKELGK